jgi:hypothetical protein
MEQSNASFEEGKRYFDNNDFSEAERHFKISLENNANHYLSFYYAGLSEIYKNEENDAFDKPLSLMRILKHSLIKVSNSLVDMKYRIPFARAAIGEIRIMMKAEFDKLNEQLGDIRILSPVRQRLLMMAKYIQSFTVIDKEAMLTFDEEMKISLVALVELGLSACVNSSVGYVIDEQFFAGAADNELDAANKIFAGLMYFLNALEDKYQISKLRPDFSFLTEFIKETETYIRDYNDALGKKNRQRYLSVPGDTTTQFVRRCRLSAEYAHYSLYKTLCSRKGDPLRGEILSHGIKACMEVIVPRIYIDVNKRVVFRSNSRKQNSEVIGQLIQFVDELSGISKKNSTDRMNEFYNDLLVMTEMYFDIVTKSFGRTINKMKARKGREFQFYVDFLLNVVNASALALTSTISLKIAKKIRIQILKIGKKAAEEFLLLHDYQIIALEKNPLCADLIKIYGAVDDEIIFLKA